MQRELVACGDGLDERGPVLLRCGSLRLVGIKDIAERPKGPVMAVLFEMLRTFHGRNSAAFERLGQAKESNIPFQDAALSFAIRAGVSNHVRTLRKLDGCLANR